MNTHESYVSLETAKMLKEVGFDWECDKFYDCTNSDCIRCEEYSVPTLDVAQKWLREMKEYHIILNHRTEIFFGERRYNLNEIKADIVNKYPGGGIYVTSTAFYRSYEEAQEAGIRKCLEILLK